MVLFLLRRAGKFNNEFNFQFSNFSIFQISFRLYALSFRLMNRYLQIIIETANTDESDIFVAHLSQAGFEGFEEEPKKLHAFIPESLYDVSKVEKIITEIKGLADPYHTLFKIEYIEPRNWNAAWEKDFDPVVVDGFCSIRAHFHEPIPGVQNDLVITPKMSFGTG